MLDKINPKAKKIFRPPYGILNPLLKRKLQKNGYQIAMFDIVGNDWEENITADKIANKVISKLKDGAIIVLHDGFGHHDAGNRSKTVEALPKIIKKVRRLGYKFVSLKELNAL